jgi:hypothetical protein
VREREEVQKVPRRVVALGALLASACQITPNFETGYRSDPTRLRSEPPRGALAVERFEDARPARKYTMAGKLFLLYIPLVPYATLEFERVDESVRIQSESIEKWGPGMTAGAEQNPAGDFADYEYPASFPRAIAADLAETGLFTSSRYGEPDASGGDRYVLEGKLRETLLDTSATSFMLGMFGLTFWLLPVPVAKTSADVQVDLRLVDRPAGKEVWRGTVRGDLSRYFTLYTSGMVYGRAGGYSFTVVPPPSDAQVNPHSLFSWHFEALRRAMLAARPEIAAALTQYEASSPP